MKKIKIQNKLIKFIALSQILGSAVGIVMLFILFFRSAQVYKEPLLAIIILSMLFFYILTIIAGYLLFREKKLGIRLSRFVQFLQIPWFYFSKYLYYNGVGFIFFVVFSFMESPETQVGFRTSFDILSARWRIGIYSGKLDGIELGLNIIALLQFIYLYKSKKIKEVMNRS